MFAIFLFVVAIAVGLYFLSMKGKFAMPKLGSDEPATNPFVGAFAGWDKPPV